MKTSHRITGAVALIASAMALVATAGAPPGRITLDRLVNLYEAVEFDHLKHTEAGFECGQCHHKPFGRPMGCPECHGQEMSQDTFSHTDHWEHVDCASCHQAASTKEALACSSCHKIPFDNDKPHVIGLKGALHAQCMDCHKQSGLPSSCVACHKKL